MAFVNKEYLLKAFDAFNDAEHAPKGWISAMNTAREIVEDAPTVGTGKVGRWNLTEAYPHRVYCSACYCTYVANDEWDIWQKAGEKGALPRNFCPNCGARMEGVDDGSD